MATYNFHSRAPQGEEDRLKIEELLLDPDNPRLVSSGGTRDQKLLLEVLWREMAVDELVLSIAHNGYYNEEPLLVISDQADKYIVIEGNRRLAAVLLLRESELRQYVKASGLPTLSKEDRAALDRLPVLIYPNRGILWAYLGFKHVNGTKPWDPFSKAKYVADVHDNSSISLDEIAKRIGDRHSTVERLYRGFKILQQAEKQAVFSVEDRDTSRFNFSHLYTATDQPEYQKFLGITSKNSLKSDPVPKSKLENLGQLLTWLYGRKSDGTRSLIPTQNPDLNTLRSVIAKPASLAAIRSGYTLQRSHEISIGDQRRFREALTATKEELQQATATVVTGFTGEQDLYQTGKDILLYAEALLKDMEQKLN